MNPLMKNVFSAFEAVANRPTSISINRAGVELYPGGHFQGIQRMQVPAVPGKTRQQNLILLTSSSDETAYLVPCSMADDWLSGQANAPVPIASLNDNPAFNHAGGCQAFGTLLAVGIENHQTNINSEVQFWNFEGNPQPEPAMMISRNGAEYFSTAGAVGVTSHGPGMVVAVASFDAEAVDFYDTEYLPRQLGGTALKFLFTWTASTANKDGWLDNNFGSYQDINLITETDGELYMVAFDHSGASDWMDLYSVDLTTEDHASALRKMATKHMYCSNGCSFNDGAGIFIAAPDHFDVYAVNGHSGDYKIGKTINVNYFSGV
jgi:hypothetical protein